MPYMLLILEDGESRRSRSPEEGQAAYARMLRFGEDLNKRGLLRASDALRSDAEGVRLTLRGGKRIVVDGPFTESKEIVGGFALLQANSKKEAIELVRQFLQVAGDGECELRQVFEAGQNTCTPSGTKS
jgi:hypothetical protein